MAIVHGTNGHDRSDLGGTDLIGTDAADTIYGYAGNDYLEGRGGNDTLDAGSGDYNTVRAGAGNDVVASAGNGGWFDGGSGIDQIIFSTASAGTYDLAAGSGKVGSAQFSVLNFENVSTGGGHDTIRGTDGANVIGAGAGNDLVEARGGDDNVYGGAGRDYVDGGSGNDGLRGEDGDDELFGGAGADTLWGGNGSDLLWGGLGDDLLHGGRGHDTLDGGEGGYDVATYAQHDSWVIADLRASVSKAWTNGYAEIDELFRIDKVIGSSFGDVLFASTNSALEGGNGDDTLYSGAGANVLAGGTGNDFVSYLFSNAGVSVNLAAQSVSGGWAAGDSLSGFENARGSEYADSLRAANGGGVLEGRGGNDALRGGTGADRIVGGSGYDQMWGDAGADVFAFTLPDDSSWSGNADQIKDFVKGTDKIDLSALDANAAAGGNNAFTNVFLSGTPYSSPAFTAGSIAYSHQTNGTTLVMANMTDGPTSFDAPELVFQINGHVSLSTSDFIL
jgi:Ca2+-binding RTX toxin-like protein